MYLRENLCHQIEPSKMKAFGIEISSQSGNAEQLCELLAFAYECEKLKVAEFVHSATYSASDGSVALMFVDDYAPSRHVLMQVKIAAGEALSSFANLRIEQCVARQCQALLDIGTAPVAAIAREKDPAVGHVDPGPNPEHSFQRLLMGPTDCPRAAAIL